MIPKTRLLNANRGLLALLRPWVAMAPCRARQAGDPPLLNDMLPSRRRRDVAKVTTDGSLISFPEGRIATFDNDGTL